MSPTIMAEPDPTSLKSRLCAAMAFMEREFRRGPNLPEIARHAHLSPFHFHRMFRRQFGKTPKDVLISLQIAEAQRLMLDGVPLSEVASQAGFAHQSHMTARFKRATGHTPKVWLALAKAGATMTRK